MFDLINNDERRGEYNGITERKGNQGIPTQDQKDS
jgi:hypothetical protein